MLSEGQLRCRVPSFLKGERHSASDNKSLCLEPDIKQGNLPQRQLLLLAITSGWDITWGTLIRWPGRVEACLSPMSPMPPSTWKSQEETGHGLHGGPPSELSVFRSGLRERRLGEAGVPLPRRQKDGGRADPVPRARRHHT